MSNSPRSIASLALAYSVLTPFFAGSFLWVWHRRSTHLAGAEDSLLLYCINMLAYGAIATVLACIPSFLAGLLWAKAIPLNASNATHAAMKVTLVAGVLGLVVSVPYFYWMSFYGPAILYTGAIGGAFAAAPLVAAMLRSAR